ncbi:MAG: UvrB/UvrC motif-containing protein [Lachnospiraceae bacterium]|nr:UvrB/UvrC motif-containing protein [Lachnospiraceae bacterium]
MLCDICHENQATILVTEILNGVKKEYHLCADCAAKRTNAAAFMAYPGSILSGIISSKIKKDAVNPDPAAAATRTCPKCGMTLSEFLKKGRFGCAACAESFSDVLDDYLKRVQGSSRHVGKSIHPGSKKSEEDILKEKLKKAVADEEYEEAAKLRDLIRALEKEGGSGEVV